MFRTIMWWKQSYLCIWISSILVVCHAYGPQSYYNDELYDAEESINGTAACETKVLNRNSSYIVKGRDGLGSCTWLFMGTNDCYPMITCTKFDIKQSHYCMQDFLALSDGSSDVGLRFCGNYRPHYATSRTSILQVMLVVNSNYGSPDFTCKVSCARHHSSYNGYGSVYNNRQSFAPKFIPTTPLKTANCDCGEKGPPIKTSPKPATDVGIQLVGGTPADPGEYRMFVDIVFKGGNTGACGGTLVSSSCVLTTARCCQFYPGMLEVLLNVVDSQNTTGSSIRIGISDFVVHPLFVDPWEYNICILNLKEPVNLTGYSRGYQSEPIFRTTCLPPRKSFDQYTNENATLVGMSDSTQIVSKTNVTIIANSNCTSFVNPLAANQMCAVGDNTGFCFGDSGIPLFKEVYKRYVQIGVASILNNCGNAGSPQLYTRVNDVGDWIRMVCNKSMWCRELN